MSGPMHITTLTMPTMPVMTRRTLLLGMAAGTTGALVSLPRAADAAEPRIRFVNAAMPGGPLDVYVDQILSAEAVEFGAASKIIDNPGVAFEVAVTPAGGGLGQTLFSRTLELDPTLTYELVVFGEAQDLRIQEFGVVLAPLGEDEATLRFFHFSPDVPPVDIHLTAGTQYLEFVVYPGPSRYLTTQAGLVDLEIVASEDQTLVLAIPGARLTAGKAHHLFLMGRSSDESVRSSMLTWWTERHAAEPTATGPTSEEIDYLTELKSTRDLLMKSLDNLYQVLIDGSYSPQYMNMLAWVCVGLISVERSLQKLAPPARYSELHQTFVIGVAPLAAGARAISTAEEWLDDEADAVYFRSSDLSPLLEAVDSTRPTVLEADAMLTAALEEAGIPPSS